LYVTEVLAPSAGISRSASVIDPVGIDLIRTSSQLVRARVALIGALPLLRSNRLVALRGRGARFGIGRGLVGLEAMRCRFIPNVDDFIASRLQAAFAPRAGDQHHYRDHDENGDNDQHYRETRHVFFPLVADR
jgi:hypothetical protein